MSDTPRTDAKLAYIHEHRVTKIAGEWDAIELADFARQLERELAECRNAALEEAAKMCEWYASWSKGPNKIDIELHKCAEAIRKLKR